MTGHIDIIKNPVRFSQSTVEINVTAQYRNHADLQGIKACHTGSGPKNEQGVLIWVRQSCNSQFISNCYSHRQAPNHPHERHRDLTFNITVALPQNLRQYKDLSTSLPAFSHNIGEFFDIWSPTSFDTIRLKSSHAPINFGVGTRTALLSDLIFTVISYGYMHSLESLPLFKLVTPTFAASSRVQIRSTSKQAMHTFTAQL